MNNDQKELEQVAAAPKREKLTLGWRGKTTPVPDITYVEEVAPAPAVRTMAAPGGIEVQPVDPWAQPDALDYCLEAWRAWMHAGGNRNLGVKIMGGLVGESDGHGGDIHEAQHSHDMRIGAATDAMIESLSRFHAWAIYASCSIATAWGFPHADLALAAAEAREALVEKLKKNSCTGSLF